MKIKISLLLVIVLTSSSLFRAQSNIVQNDTLKEVVITSTRIDIPFKENSRTINIVTSKDIANSAATNVADLSVLSTKETLRVVGT